MPMAPFYQRFPLLAVRETRSVTGTGRNDLPDGNYGFVELYCDEPYCDCRRVMLVVLRPETGWDKVWATINYGWESLEFYRQWARAPEWDHSRWQGPFLDPLSAQTSYSPALLDTFKFLLQSPDYGRRLREHYLLFRGAVDQDPPRRNHPPSPRGDAQKHGRRNRRRPPYGPR